MEGGVFQEMYLAEAIYERCRKKDRIKTTELVARQEKKQKTFSLNFLANSFIS